MKERRRRLKVTVPGGAAAARGKLRAAIAREQAKGRLHDLADLDLATGETVLDLRLRRKPPDGPEDVGADLAEELGGEIGGLSGARVEAHWCPHGLVEGEPCVVDEAWTATGRDGGRGKDPPGRPESGGPPGRGER